MEGVRDNVNSKGAAAVERALVQATVDMHSRAFFEQLERSGKNDGQTLISDVFLTPGKDAVLRVRRVLLGDEDNPRVGVAWQLRKKDKC